MDLKRIFLLGSIIFTSICLVLFYHLTSLNQKKFGSEDEIENQRQQHGQPPPPPAAEEQADEQNSYYNRIESKVNSLQKSVEQHRISMKVLENVAFHGSGDDVDRLGHQCSSSGMNGSAKVDIDMLKVYNEYNFEDIDGGVWKQGWPIEIDRTRFTTRNKLRVFIIPHSHNDPGWIKTFNDYFQTQTKFILDNMLKFLTKNPDLKFIWAEISYFDLWWKDLTENEQELVRKIVASKQLEFVSGGWVMPDEANTHYYSMLVQLIEGHQWLHNVFNYTVTSSWSIDPFGLTPTLPYLLKQTQVNSHLIQRVHYSIKKYLARRKELEFYWRQRWDLYNKTDVLTHVMPFYSYDVPHTCGPDPSICCQFDFKRLRGVSSITCPWRKHPMAIMAKNVRERAMLLADQYKKKAMLYKTSNLLIPLGDDFRWIDEPEWEAQSTNYMKLIDYINSKPDEFQMEVHFSTLSDYFNALKRSSEDSASSGDSSEHLPALTGDFFTYSDINDNYWSGYYTSRPFYKGFERELMSKVRSAHLIYTVTALKHSSNRLSTLTSKLTIARRWLSLFQHHDGITGTAKDHVMIDYGVKMFEAIQNCDEVIATCLNLLSSASQNAEQLETKTFKPAESRLQYDQLNNLNTIHFENGQRKYTLAVFNNSPRERFELINLQVDSYRVKVVDPQTKSTLETQILPQFDGEFENQIKSATFELNFLVKISALSVKYLLIEYSPEIELRTKVNVTTYGPQDLPSTDSNDLENVFNVVHNILPKPTKIAAHTLLENKWIKVMFNFESNVKPLKIIFNGSKKKIEIGWWTYSARHPNPQNKHSTSGLYLFLPGGPATKLSEELPTELKLIQSKFISYIEINFGNWLKQKITIFNWGENVIDDHQTIEIENTFNLHSKHNFELMLKFETDLKTKDLFYTDLNGFQMTKRQHFNKLPLQANYYPIPTVAFIEDDEYRFTVLSKQPLGGSSLADGELEIMMDRTLEQDDNRGVFQGAKDNLWTKNTFRIMLEKIHCQDPHKDKSHPQLSLKAELTRNTLLNPVNIFYTEEQVNNNQNQLEIQKQQQQLELGCDLELVDSIPLELDDHDANSFGLILRRLSFDDRFNTATSRQDICDNYQPTNQVTKLKEKMKELFLSSADEEKDGPSSLNLDLQHTSLDFILPILFSEEESNNNDKLNPMELVGFKMKARL